MPGRRATMAMAIVLIGGSTLSARAGRTSALSAARQEPPRADALESIVTGRVERIHGPQLFTIARDDETSEHELLVFTPTADVSLVRGSRIAVRGVLRPCDETELAKAGRCEHFDDLAATNSPLHQVLVARSLVTSTRYELPEGPAISLQQEERFAVRLPDLPMPLHPHTLAAFIDTLAGHSVRLTPARVVGVFDPRVFLVESQTTPRPMMERNRVLVFIEPGRLRVEPSLLVAETVALSGVARTLLGMQVGAEVPWPPELTRDVVNRLDIRAALLATAVQTPEGIDLIIPSSSVSRPSRSISR